MKKIKLPIGWIIGGVLLLFGFMLLAHNILTAADAERRFLRRQEALRTLRMLSDRARQDEAALLWYQELPDRNRQPVESLRAYLEKQGAAQWTGLGAEPVLDSWVQERLRIAVDRMDYNDLAVFLNQAAAMRPPWGLAGIDLKPAETEGSGQAVLTMTSLYEKR